MADKPNSNIPEFIRNREKLGMRIITGILFVIGGVSLAILAPIIIASFVLLAATAQLVIIMAAVFGLMVLLFGFSTARRLYRAFGRKLIGLIVPLAPIEVMQEAQEEAREAQKGLAEQMQAVSGERLNVERLLSVQKAECAKIVAAVRALSDDDPLLERKELLLAEELDHAEAALAEYQQSFDHVSRYEAQVKDRLDECRRFIEKKDRDIEAYRRRMRLSESLVKVKAKADSIMARAESYDEEMWRNAKEYIDDRWASAQAGMEMMADESRPAQISHAIDRTAALQRLREVRQGKEPGAARTHVRVAAELPAPAQASAPAEENPFAQIVGEAGSKSGKGSSS